MERKWQSPRVQLEVAVASLREARETEGFGTNFEAHLDRAFAHVMEATFALDQPTLARSVDQLTDYLNQVQKMKDEARLAYHEQLRGPKS